MKYEISFGDGVQTVELDQAAVLQPSFSAPSVSKKEEEIVRDAMAHPIDSPPLYEIAKGKKTAVIIISDHTRPVPSKKILPAMLEELRRFNPEIDISLLVATGFHRGTTPAELVNKLGEDLLAKEKIVVHDCKDKENNVQIGILPSGAPLVINRLAAEADLVVSEGFIEPHFFAGFSGGRKSILPGICDRTTVLGNHCSKFIDSPSARTGKLLHNPIHEDMIAAARLANLQFIVNVLLDEDKKIVAAVAGDFEKAHAQGCEIMRSQCSVHAVPADIVFTSNGGYPLDQNIYQSVKGLTAAEATAKPGAVLITCAECRDGTGGDDFYHSLHDCESVESLYQSLLKIPMDQTIPDQWETQILCRIMRKHHVIFVAAPEMEKTIREMKLDYAKTAEEALEIASRDFDQDPSITVIPNGISVIVE
ncbi:MAG: nickel-dependent lactate racemase [Planctomycetia bacterium]|nr:nickel-dependent lactate racemase [Planctomycetia bacterium]